MTKSNRLQDRDLQKIENCWDQLHRYPDSEIDAALNFLMETLRDLVSAQAVNWAGFRGPDWSAPGSKKTVGVDPLHANCSWNCLVLMQLDADPENYFVNEMVMENQRTVASVTTRALAQSAGSFRVERLRDPAFVDYEEVRRSPIYKTLHVPNDLRDSLYVGSAVEPGAESFLLPSRFGKSELFSPEDAARCAALVRPLGWFHRRVMASFGLVGSSEPFSVIERRIFRLLLTARNEPQIAEVLNQSPKTTHKYITDLFRKMRVKGRPGFAARWHGEN